MPSARRKQGMYPDALPSRDGPELSYTDKERCARDFWME